MAVTIRLTDSLFYVERKKYKYKYYCCSRNPNEVHLILTLNINYFQKFESWCKNYYKDYLFW